MEGLHQDGVGVNVIRQHDVVIAAAGADGEAPHVVGEELADGFGPDVKFSGFDGWKLAGDVRECVSWGRFWLG